MAGPLTQASGSYWANLMLPTPREHRQGNCPTSNEDRSLSGSKAATESKILELLIPDLAPSSVVFQSSATLIVYPWGGPFERG